MPSLVSSKMVAGSNVAGTLLHDEIERETPFGRLSSLSITRDGMRQRQRKLCWGRVPGSRRCVVGRQRTHLVAARSASAAGHYGHGIRKQKDSMSSERLSKVPFHRDVSPQRRGIRTSELSCDGLRTLSSRWETVVVQAKHADYSAKAGDGTILQLPLKSPLTTSQIRNVFGYPRNLREMYHVGSVLGAGSFGVVREARERSTGRIYAIKSIPKTPKQNKPTPRYLLKLQTEVDAMAQLGASFDAVFLKDVFEDDMSIHLVMELCEGGSVLDRLKDGEYSEHQVAHVMRSVMRFLSQCHSKGLVYRDVKPENFMILEKHTSISSGKSTKKSGENREAHSHEDGNDGFIGDTAKLWRNISRAVRIGGEDKRRQESSGQESAENQKATPKLSNIGHSTVKATDFGLAIRHTNDEPPLKSRSGTPAYMAPEVIKQQYDCKADVWSAGIMMWQLLTGRFPFWKDVRDCTLQQVWSAILQDEIDFEAPELRQISPQARDLLQSMLNRDPEQRISASGALHHEWLQKKGAASPHPLRSSVVQRLQRFATYSRLKQVVFRLITDEFKDMPSSRPEARALMDGLTVLFNELDLDASGSLSMEELVQGFEHLGYEVSAEELEQLMNRVDTNKDGSLQLSEFVACLVDWEELEEKDSQWDSWVEMVFKRLDKNHDGFISLSSLEDLLICEELMTPDELGAKDVVPSSARSENPSRDSGSQSNASLSSSKSNKKRDLEKDVKLLEARRMLREADANGDGRVSREEFNALLAGGSISDQLDQYDARLKMKAPVSRPDLASVDEELIDGGFSSNNAIDLNLPGWAKVPENKGALLETLESDGEKLSKDVD